MTQYASYFVLLAVATTATFGCGGSQTEAEVPEARVAGAAGEGGRGEGAPGASADDGRPDMNPAAVAAYRAGQEAFKRGDLAGAKAQFQAAVRADANAYEAHFALGATLQRLGEPAAAISAYRRALDIAPAYGPAVEAVTRLYILEERVSDAEALLNQLRSKTKGDAAVLAALAEVKSVQKDSGAAQDFAQQALKANPDYKPAMVALARDHYRNRRLDLALYALTAILDGYGPENPPRDKDNGEARLIRALIYKEQGQRKPAIDELARVLEVRPDIVEARLNLAVFMLEAGNSNEAIPVLEGALAYDPNDVLVHLNLGDAYRLQGRPDEALKQLEWVTRAAPKLAQAHYNIGLVYLFSANPPGITPAQAVDKAIEAFETYKKMQPRTRAGAGDDADELLARARNKKAVMEAMSAPSPQGADDGFDEEGFDDDFE